MNVDILYNRLKQAINENTQFKGDVKKLMSKFRAGNVSRSSVRNGITALNENTKRIVELLKNVVTVKERHKVMSLAHRYLQNTQNEVRNALNPTSNNYAAKLAYLNELNSLDNQIAEYIL